MTDLSDSQIPTLVKERADFYLMMARAFLPPMAAKDVAAMTEFLADDLADIDASLGYNIAAEVGMLRQAFSRLEGHDALLVEYSSLFLQPPREASLNACQPIDGAILGGTVAEIEAFYRNFGIERGDQFKDLPDHVSVQLEFVSYLYGQAAASIAEGGENREAESAAGHFLHQFVARWLPHLELAIERSGLKLELKANPYLPLVRILASAVAKDAALNPDWVQPKPRVEKAIEKARQDYSSRGITADALAEIERKLREKGLSTEHVQIALGQRNEAMGLSAKSPPDPRRK